MTVLGIDEHEADTDHSSGHVDETDPRYEDLVKQANNRRLTPRPASFRVARDTAQVVRAVEDAIRADKRVFVRSGGHGYEDLVGDKTHDLLLIDLSQLNTIRFDSTMRAFEIGAGARIAEVYRTLYHGWGVTVPAGDSATVGFGGHVVGGGYGSLSRAHGLAADHLYAVEVVVVDASGHARSVVATREANDPNRDLWWAHTGGGGGTFGVVTRYWFRSPSAEGADPTRLLPRPPAGLLSSTLLFPRSVVDKGVLQKLLGNFGRWHERNSAPDSPYNGLFAGIVLPGRTSDEDMAAVAFTHVDASLPNAEGLLRDYLAELTDGLGVEPVTVPTETVSYLAAKKALAAAQDGEVGRQKAKSAFLRSAYTDEQAGVLYDYLNSTEHSHDTSLVALQSYGGRINEVPPHATASAQRDSVMQAFFMNTWHEEDNDEAGLDWMRRLFRDLHAGTGGAPVSDEITDGCYVNFPDTDMSDPEWNTSGVPWQELYFKENHAALRRVKAEWDPGNVFRHALSIRPND
ncbi:hypothetical protein J2S53_003056 [Actinopolyspora lacussalsi]|nr:hypothetical protein [Actinopolyspora lacussalsi]